MNDRKRLYNIWHCMNNRCSKSIESAFYRNYRRFNVNVCDEWKNCFDTFFTWAMANGYRDGLIIDRIDTQGDYTPDNCRFVTQKDNSRNRTDTVYISYEGQRKPLAEWAEIFEISRDVLYGRVKNGWSMKEAVTRPVRVKRKRRIEDMTQNKADVKRLAELNALFLTLDDKGQDSALTILRSLGFAQSVMCSPHSVEQPRKPPVDRPA